MHSIDTFCNVYKRDNLDKVVPSTKTVYKMIHRRQIEGIKPYMLSRMTKLKPRRKTDGQCNTKKNKRILGTSIEQRPEHINSREEKGHFEIDAVKGKNGKNEACIITLIDRKTDTHISFFSQAECPECQQGSTEAIQKSWKKEFQIQQAGRAGKQKHESVLCTSIFLIRTWNKRKHKRIDKRVPSEREEHERKREGNTRNTKNFK